MDSPVADGAGLLVLLPFAGFLANGAIAFLRPRAKKAVTAIGVGSVAAAFAVGLVIFAAMLRSHTDVPIVRTYFSWLRVGTLSVDAALLVDHLSIVMVLVVTGVSTLIHVFSVGYMGEDPGYARYFAFLNLFVAFMLVLVLGASFPVLFVGWEGVGLCSYLLIGFWFEDEQKAAAGLKAFLVNRIGDAGFLVGMFLIFKTLGTLDFAQIAERAPQYFVAGDPVVTAIALLLFLGCVGKSAQIPLYIWLPDAMAGPTPVSALIHAATMVTAGVFLVARASVFFGLSSVASAVVAGIGALTALFAATIGLKQWDIKKVLAYSTVSQLGYMFVGVGSAAYAAGIFHLATHAFFKALLFLGSGSVIHAMHRAYHRTHSHADPQDMRNMGGLRAYLPTTFATMWIATLAIAGIPPLAGFFSKDEILASAFARGQGRGPYWYVIWLFGAAAALLTAFYMARLMLYTFHGPNRTGDAERPHLAESPAIMTVPLVALAALTVLGGVINLPDGLPGASWLHRWLEPVVGTATSIAGPAELGRGTQITLIVVAVALAVTGLWLAFTRLHPEQLVSADRAPAEQGFAKLLAEKYHVDEIYDVLIVRPLVWVSRNVLWKGLDAGAVDGAAVNGSATAAKTIGWLGTRLQTGQVGMYVAFFVIGVLALLGALAR